MKKEKIIRTHQRRTKSGKVVTVHKHNAKYDAADKLKTIKRKGSGEELKNRRTLDDLYEGYDFTEEDFKEWYEGTDSDADKKVAKVLRKILGRKAYNELSDLAANNYRKGGANSFFRKNVAPKTKIDDNKLMDKILGVESTGKVGNKVFGVGVAKLLDSRGNVIGVTLDTPNAIAHAMAKYKDIASAEGILGQEYREYYADRFDYAIKDKNLGVHLKMNTPRKESNIAEIIKRDRFKVGNQWDSLTFIRVINAITDSNFPTTEVTLGKYRYKVSPTRFGVKVVRDDGKVITGEVTRNLAIVGAFNKVYEIED